MQDIYTPHIPLPVCPKLIKSNKETASWGEGAAEEAGEKKRSSAVSQKGEGKISPNKGKRHKWVSRYTPITTKFR